MPHADLMGGGRRLVGGAIPSDEIHSSLWRFSFLHLELVKGLRYHL